MVNCPNCDSEQSDCNRFCSVCGEPLLGKLVFAGLRKQGDKYFQPGLALHSLKEFLYWNDMAFEEGLLIVCCYEEDLKPGNTFIPHQVWMPTAHHPVRRDSFKITMA
jgi:hypothetical protein